MLRRILKQIVIRNRDYATQTSLSRVSSRKVNLEVKINKENETFELHDAEVDATSGKQKKFEFPFVYLRDNCQVGCRASSSSRYDN
jgi:hypothetical protein